MQMPRQVTVRINAALASTNVLNTHTHHAHHIYAHAQVQGGLPQPACVIFVFSKQRCLSKNIVLLPSVVGCYDDQNHGIKSRPPEGGGP